MMKVVALYYLHGITLRCSKRKGQATGVPLQSPRRSSCARPSSPSEASLAVAESCPPGRRCQWHHLPSHGHCSSAGPKQAAVTAHHLLVCCRRASTHPVGSHYRPEVCHCATCTCAAMVPSHARDLVTHRSAPQWIIPSVPLFQISKKTSYLDSPKQFSFQEEAGGGRD